MLTEAWALVIAAGVAAVGGITVALIQQFRKENRRDHGIVMEALERVSHTMDRVEGKVDSHLEWHIKETGNGRTVRRNKIGGRKAS
jgi:low affinity Fe/Cu permease